MKRISNETEYTDDIINTVDECLRVHKRIEDIINLMTLSKNLEEVKVMLHDSLTVKSVRSKNALLSTLESLLDTMVKQALTLEEVVKSNGIKLNNRRKNIPNSSVDVKKILKEWNLCPDEYDSNNTNCSSISTSHFYTHSQMPNAHLASNINKQFTKYSSPEDSPLDEIDSVDENDIVPLTEDDIKINTTDVVDANNHSNNEDVAQTKNTKTDEPKKRKRKLSQKQKVKK